ncbi:MAG: DUF2808 domain-containing protein [Cyanobacteriota bacterium]|nr:DUF2808 domain-containing protein [Cyanobacteriota bacterium]
MSRRLSPSGGRSSRLGLVAGLVASLALPGVLLLSSQPARAQGTPGLMEFRWDNSKDYRKLYFFQTDTTRLKLSDYYLILRPKDRKTAILKLTVSLPKSFDSKIEPNRVKLCRMSEGGMLKRTRCDKQIPATVEVNQKAGTIEIFPETPISDKSTIGVFMRIFNPFNIGMYQFNALAQAPGDIPISSYLGSWLIQIDANASN